MSDLDLEQAVKSYKSSPNDDAAQDLFHAMCHATTHFITNIQDLGLEPDKNVIDLVTQARDALSANSVTPLQLHYSRDAQTRVTLLEALAAGEIERFRALLASRLKEAMPA